MSQIYSSLPKTHGKVIVVTDCGDIEIELFARETPKACRNFVQLCLEDFYNGLLFHRIVSEQFVQSGDPTNNGDVGESIFDDPSSPQQQGKAFEAEYHSRLKFSQRGLVACASQNNMSDSRFFITLNRLDALNFKHTIFGQIVGNTFFNVLKIAELEVDDNDRPIYPPKIIRTEVIVNPFPDIVPRKKSGSSDSSFNNKKRKKESRNILSFSDEIEETNSSSTASAVPITDEDIKAPMKKKEKKEHNTEPTSFPLKSSSTPIVPLKETIIEEKQEEIKPSNSTGNEFDDDLASRFSSLRKQKEEQIKTDSENQTKQDAKQYLSNQLQKYKKKTSKEDRESIALEKFQNFNKLLKSSSSSSSSSSDWKKHELNYKKE